MQEAEGTGLGLSLCRKIVFCLAVVEICDYRSENRQPVAFIYFTILAYEGIKMTMRITCFPF